MLNQKEKFSEIIEMMNNNKFECNEMIRTENGIMIVPNKNEKLYDYYIFTKDDNKFHRCNKNGKFGAKGQTKFMSYKNINKTFEIIGNLLNL